jgi:hypothetical protein
MNTHLIMKVSRLTFSVKYLDETGMGINVISYVFRSNVRKVSTILPWY